MPRLAAISVGSNPKGRDFGVLPGSRGVRLSNEAGAMLADFSLALLGWGQAAEGNFAAFFPLHRDGSQFCLFRVAYMGRGDLGPLVIANGLLLSRDDCAVFGSRPHRLLAAIKPPQSGPWDRESIDASTEKLPSRSPSPANPRLIDLAESLHLFERTVVVATDDPEAVLGTLLEAERPLPEWLPSWSTSDAIGRNGRFDPGAFDLYVVPRKPERPVATDGFGSSFDLPPIPRSPSWNVWKALFGPLFRAAVGDRSAWLAARAASPWRREFAAVDPFELARVTIGRFLASPDLASDDFWWAMEFWVDATARLETADRASAQRGVALAYSDLLERQSSGAAKAVLTGEYLARYAHRLPHAPPLNIARVAIEHDVLRELEDAPLLAMLDDAYVSSLTGPFVAAVSAGALRTDQLATVAAHLASQIDDKSYPPGADAVAVVVVREGLAANAGETVAALGRKVMPRIGDAEAARGLAGGLFGYWLGRRDPVAKALRGDVEAALRAVLGSIRPTPAARSLSRAAAAHLGSVR